MNNKTDTKNRYNGRANDEKCGRTLCVPTNKTDAMNRVPTIDNLKILNSNF